MSWRVIEADCVEAMRDMEADSIDAVVTDPPAGISFMGRGWDSDRSGGFVAWLASVMEEALRVTKPGGHALVWALPRTSHWTGSAIEAAGWEIRDRIAHHFGSGFPKSHNLGNGFGTALKPATEDWWLARKPLVGTVAQNVERFGTGALAIDRCRIGTELVESGREGRTGPGGEWEGGDLRPTENGGEVTGRWPANVTLSHIESQSCPTCEGTGLKSAATGAGDSFPPGLQCEACDGRGMLGCQRVGERRVKAHGPPATNSTMGGIFGNDKDAPSQNQYSDPDGLETVEAWSCAPGCAVAELDRQSGERPGASSNSDHGTGYWKNADGGIPLQPGYGDTGGASRFFATFQPQQSGLGVVELIRDVNEQSDFDADQRRLAIRQLTNAALTVPPASEAEPRFRYVAKASRAERGAGLDGSAYGDSKIGVCQCPRNQGVPEPPRVTDADTEGEDLDSSTIGSGSKPTARSPKASKSTTSTGTARTTGSKTSPSSPPPSTSESTPPTSGELATDGSGDVPSAASGSPPTPNTSISQSRDGSSTGAVDPATSPESSRTSSSVGSGRTCPDCGGVVQGALRNSHPT